MRPSTLQGNESAESTRSVTIAVQLIQGQQFSAMVWEKKNQHLRGTLFSSIIGNIFNGSDGFLQVVATRDPLATSLALTIGRYVDRDGRHPNWSSLMKASAAWTKLDVTT